MESLLIRIDQSLYDWLDSKLFNLYICLSYSYLVAASVAVEWNLL